MPDLKGIFRTLLAPRGPPDGAGQQSSLFERFKEPPRGFSVQSSRGCGGDSGDANQLVYTAAGVGQRKWKAIGQISGAGEAKEIQSDEGERFLNVTFQKESFQKGCQGQKEQEEGQRCGWYSESSLYPKPSVNCIDFSPLNAESSEDEEEEVHAAPQVISTMELPEGARLSDSEEDSRLPSDPHRALNIDLDE